MSTLRSNSKTNNKTIQSNRKRKMTKNNNRTTRRTRMTKMNNKTPMKKTRTMENSTKNRKIKMSPKIKKNYPPLT